MDETEATLRQWLAEAGADSNEVNRLVRGLKNSAHNAHAARERERAEAKADAEWEMERAARERELQSEQDALDEQEARDRTRATILAHAALQAEDEAYKLRLDSAARLTQLGY